MNVENQFQLFRKTREREKNKFQLKWKSLQLFRIEPNTIGLKVPEIHLFFGFNPIRTKLFRFYQNVVSVLWRDWCVWMLYWPWWRTSKQQMAHTFISCKYTAIIIFDSFTKWHTNPFEIFTIFNMITCLWYVHEKNEKWESHSSTSIAHHFKIRFFFYFDIKIRNNIYFEENPWLAINQNISFSTNRTYTFVTALKWIGTWTLHAVSSCILLFIRGEKRKEIVYDDW